jgi:hypothetical protein
MKKWVWLVLIAAAAAMTRSAHAAQTVITFGNVSRDIGDDGPLPEFEFQYSAIGPSWSIQTDFGAFTLPNHALTTFWGMPSAVGNSITFTRLDGDDFFFESVNIFGRVQGAPNDVLQAQGFRDGVQVGTLTLQSSLQAYTTIDTRAAFAAPIDSLRLLQTQSNDSALILDNLVFSEVPEPGSMALVLAAGGLLLRRRERG